MVGSVCQEDSGSTAVRSHLGSQRTGGRPLGSSGCCRKSSQMWGALVSPGGCFDGAFPGAGPGQPQAWGEPP